MEEQWLGSAEDTAPGELISLLQRVVNVQGFIIIASSRVMAIGEVLAGVSNMNETDKVHHPFVITRVSTYEEWVKQNKEVVRSRNPYAKPMGWDWFYEVRTD